MKSNLMLFLAVFFLLAGTSRAYVNVPPCDSNCFNLKMRPVEIMQVVINEKRSREEILQVVNANTPVLKSIYNEYLKQKPGFSGKITLKFTIDASGDIIIITILSSTTGYAEFDNAIKNEVATWKWKAIKGGNTTPTIPFNFTE
jgi:TonB family protein